MPEWRKWRGLPAVCAVLLIFSAMACGWIAVGKVQLCLFRLFTGLPCPGCGLCHAGVAMLKGRWLDSFRFHPLLIPVLFTLAVAAGSKYISFCRRLHFSRFFYPAMLVLLFALYAVRVFLFFPDGPMPMVWDEHSLAGKILPALKSLF